MRVDVPFFFLGHFLTSWTLRENPFGMGDTKTGIRGGGLPPPPSSFLTLPERVQERDPAGGKKKHGTENTPVFERVVLFIKEKKSLIVF